MSKLAINQKGTWTHFSLMKMRKKIKIYDKQRSLDESRVDEIKKHFIKGILKDGDPKIRGAVTICCVKTSPNEYVLIDGQHRYEALCKIIDDGIVEDCNLMFQMVVVQDINEIHDEFRNINKNVPVPVHYIDINNAINDTTSKIMKSYPKSLNKNTLCKRPSININTFKDTLIKSNVTNHISFLNIDVSNVSDHIFKKLCEYSRLLGEKGVDFFVSRVNSKKQKETTKNIYEKCSNGEYLFMGIYVSCDEWIKDFVQYVNKDVNCSESESDIEIIQ